MIFKVNDKEVSEKDFYKKLSEAIVSHNAKPRSKGFEIIEIQVKNRLKLDRQVYIPKCFKSNYYDNFKAAEEDIFEMEKIISSSGGGYDSDADAFDIAVELFKNNFKKVL